jgi:hypothetical protein
MVERALARVRSKDVDLGSLMVAIWFITLDAFQYRSGARFPVNLIAAF